VRRGDADAGVGHLELGALVLLAEPHRDGAALAVVLDGVVEQVGEQAQRRRVADQAAASP
jgi:hypothetical protein